MAEYVTVWRDHEPTKLHWGAPVVRCRDCKHCVADPEPIDHGWPLMCDDTGRDMLDPNGFCSWGERRDA